VRVDDVLEHGTVHHGGLLAESHPHQFNGGPEGRERLREEGGDKVVVVVPLWVERPALPGAHDATDDVDEFVARRELAREALGGGDPRPPDLAVEWRQRTGGLPRLGLRLPPWIRTRPIATLD